MQRFRVSNGATIVYRRKACKPRLDLCFAFSTRGFGLMVTLNVQSRVDDTEYSGKAQKEPKGKVAKAGSTTLIRLGEPQEELPRRRRQKQPDGARTGDYQNLSQDTSRQTSPQAVAKQRQSTRRSSRLSQPVVTPPMPALQTRMDKVTVKPHSKRSVGLQAERGCAYAGCQS